MPTPKSIRPSPARRFEEYIFTRTTSSEAGLIAVSSDRFTPIPGSVGQGYTLEAVSDPVPIGFDFSYDGIVYKSFVASTSGWIALVDPTTGTFTTADVITGGTNYTSSRIKATFVGSPVLLAPWFDDLTNVTNNLSDLGFAMTAARMTRILGGLETPPAQYSLIDYGVKYFYDVRSPAGRRTIVRWNSITTPGTIASSVVRFEVAIYENGLIEFRYAARSGLAVAAALSEEATIGIFMPNGTNRFRDMSFGLGHNDTNRQQYRYGGAEYSSGYSDTNIWGTSPYNCNLKPDQHWPGLNSEGTIFAFVPPVARRKVLPRSTLRESDSRISLPLNARTGDQRSGTKLSPFDDRRSIVYSSGSGINYPTTLPRFYADSCGGISQRQNIFFGDFELTASTVKSATENFVENDQQTYVQQFNESWNPEQNASTTNSFFASGSNVEIVGEGLSSPLRSKTQLKLTLPINHPTTLLPTTSSICYYNFKIGQFQNVPRPYDDGGTVTGKSDFGNAVYEAATLNRRVIETARGFSAWGSAVVSGSAPIATNEQTSVNINRAYTQVNETEALSDAYEKSVTKNSDYDANSDQLVNIPINHPFLLEKAVIEIPFTAGDGWFQDNTESFLELSALQSLDVGGPGITVALMNQIHNETGNYRDIIMTGTITHSRDNYSSVVISNFPDYPLVNGDRFQVRQKGFLSLGSPSAVVTPNSSSTVGYNITGSVVVPLEAAISNGVTLRYLFAGGGAAATQRDQITTILTSPRLNPISYGGAFGNVACNIGYIDAMGRAQTGTEPAGRSLYGKEFITSQNTLRFGTVKNPLYVSASFSDLPAQMQAAITAGTNFTAVSAIPMGSTVPSPYLIMPGDQLVLGIAKTRPHLFMVSGSSPPGHKHFSSSVGQSVGHDFSIMTGTVNITLYGSLLKENREFHDTLNQPLASDAIHELFVGGSPILDEFDVSYRGSYYGSTSDDYVTGSMIVKSTGVDGLARFITGSRGRVFSKLRVRTQAMPDQIQTGYEALVNPSLAFRLRSWYEFVGTNRFTRISSNSERYYDSFVPALNEVLNIDGTGLSLTINDPSNSFSYYNIGFVVFNDSTMSPKISNDNWLRAYPFEPRYASATRQGHVNKTFIADRTYDASMNTVVNSLPKVCDGLRFIFSGRLPPPFSNLLGLSGSLQQMGYGYQYAADISVRDTFPGGYLITGSLSAEDVTKAFYGFGDQNNMQYYDWTNETTPIANGQTFGSNQIPQFYGSAGSPSIGVDIVLGPVIRGWKYGIYSGMPVYSSCVFRRNRYGQLRDMLEQRQYTKYSETAATQVTKPGIQSAVVTVKFVDITGRGTNPQNTWSQNQSMEVTSSLPYFDGLAVSRPPIDLAALNVNTIVITTDALGNPIL